MKVLTVTITLEELQAALHAYTESRGFSQPETVIVDSYDSARIWVDLRPGGVVEATAFRHRTAAAT